MTFPVFTKSTLPIEDIKHIIFADRTLDPERVRILIHKGTDCIMQIRLQVVFGVMTDYMGLHGQFLQRKLILCSVA